MEWTMRMLFVDKEKSVLETLYPLLAKKNNAEFKIAGSSQQAVAVLKEGFIPDFMFIDYDTPPGNGMDVVLYLQTRGLGDKIKVLMTTDLGNFKKVESLADMLQVRFEQKPLQLFALQRFINDNLPKA
jgi:DNA-binding NtrC family response regulator